MDTKRVTLLFEGFDQEGAESWLRSSYQHVMMPLVTTLLPRWTTDAEQTLGEDHAVVTEAFDRFIDLVNDTCGVMSANGLVACFTRFGYYDAARDAAILELVYSSDIHDNISDSISPYDLFEGIFSHAKPHLFLVFSLKDIRIGNVVFSSEADCSAPEFLTPDQRDEIFEAAGISKPQ